jgi:type IV secretory pathway TrbF-like protein
MLKPHDTQNGISTKPYQSRVTSTRRTQEVVQELAKRRGRIFNNDTRLLSAILVLVLALGGSVWGNIQQGLHGVKTEVQLMYIDYRGNAKPAIKLADLSVTPEQANIMGVLQRWMTLQRRLPDDPIVLGQNWEEVDAFSTNAAIKQLELFRREQKTRQEMHRRVEVARVSILPVGSKSRSYLVSWDEFTRDQNGELVREESGYWEATVTVADFQTKAVQQQRELRLKKRDYRNILGIFVDDIAWKGRPMFFTPQPGEGR